MVAPLGSSRQGAPSLAARSGWVDTLRRASRGAVLTHPLTAAYHRVYARVTASQLSSPHRGPLFWPLESVSRPSQPHTAHP